MVFSSSPLHLDPPKWNQQPSGISIQSDPLQILSSPPPPAAGGSGGTGSIRPGSMVDRARLAQLPLPEPGLKCPRCDSTNTKFCYFNNYNLSQPRHFCKACRRYWTRGGALRNVPVGGGCRRNKRKGRNKSAPVPATQRRAGGSNAVPSSPNTNTNSNNFSSQMLLLPPPPQPSFFPGLHHLNGYVGDFGLNLGGGDGGGGEVDQFEMGASRSSGVSRVQQLSNLFTGSDLTGNGLYPFHGSGQLDDNSEFGEAGRVKMEGNNGVNLPNNVMGTQGDEDQYGAGWGSGSGWTDISGFHGSSSAGHLL